MITIIRLTLLSMGTVMILVGITHGEIITSLINPPFAQALWFGLGATLLLLGAAGGRR